VQLEADTDSGYLAGIPTMQSVVRFTGAHCIMTAKRQHGGSRLLINRGEAATDDLGRGAGSGRIRSSGNFCS